MPEEYLRNMDYDPLEWEDRVEDDDTGEVLVEGTPVNEVNMNRIEAGILRALYDLGLNNFEGGSMLGDVLLELEKYRKQRFLQGKDTITSSGDDDYFRESDPEVLISFPDDAFPLINYPDYDVSLSILDADDLGKVGELIAYDKAENGFKVKMTGSAEEVTFMWTVLNPKAS